MRPIRTRFRYGFPTRVNLATQRKLAGSFFKRHAVTQQVELQRIVGTWFQVLFHSPPGVLFTFPSRYWSAIGHRGVFRLNGWSRQIHTPFQEWRVTWEVSNTAAACRLRGYHPLRHRFPTDFDLNYGFLLCATPADAATTLPRPPLRNPCRVSHEVGLASSDFARHYSRNHGCFLFLWVLRCFTSPRSLHTPYFIQVQVTGHNSSWVSPFGHPRINARLPTPQGISQAPTSFIGSRCQGIHHVPLITCPQQTTNTHNKPPNQTL
jgi:hypothetical protein